jgi:hypothetical protein
MQTFAPPPFNESREWTGETAVLMCIRAAVLSAPGQNGHIYLDVAPPPGDDWTACSYVACRNEKGAKARIANGATLVAIVQPGWHYRLRTHTVQGFAEPTWILDTADCGAVAPLPLP